MTFAFKPAVREQIPLLIGLAGGTGSGKTWTALELAVGLAMGKRFAFIDTESGRAKHYADQFPMFDHGDLGPPFRPGNYWEAIKAADDAHYPVIVVDSASHEWSGAGGILDWQEEEMDRMAGDPEAQGYWAKREAVKMAAWIKPKVDHKKMVSRLLQIRAHVILCFRAEEKVEMTRDPETRKMLIQPKVTKTGLEGWVPICEKNLPFELTMSFLLHSDNPGVPRPIKLEAQHRPFFPLDKPITRESGRLIGEWAAGGKPKQPSPPDTDRRSLVEKSAREMGLLTDAGYDVEKFAAAYTDCEDAEGLARLEGIRELAWKAIPTGEIKTQLKAAADAAKARVPL